MHASILSLSVALHDVDDVVDGDVLSDQHLAIVDLVLGQDPLHLTLKGKSGAYLGHTKGGFR